MHSNKMKGLRNYATPVSTIKKANTAEQWRILVNFSCGTRRQDESQNPYTILLLLSRDICCIVILVILTVLPDTVISSFRFIFLLVYRSPPTMEKGPVSCLPTTPKMSKPRKVIEDALENQNPELDLADKGVVSFEEMPGLSECTNFKHFLIWKLVSCLRLPYKDISCSPPQRRLPNSQQFTVNRLIYLRLERSIFVCFRWKNSSKFVYYEADGLIEILKNITIILEPS